MQVTWVPEQSAFANSYIYGTILVDAGLPPMAIRPYKDEIDTIVLTHCHFDHTARIKEIAYMCKAKVAIHKNDARGLVDDAQSLSMNFGARSPGIAPDIVLDEGDIIGELMVLHTPGHTPEVSASFLSGTVCSSAVILFFRTVVSGVMISRGGAGGNLHSHSTGSRFLMYMGCIRVMGSRSQPAGVATSQQRWGL
jgi:glyoxylase-like metal-dependent hydrolase (beta-lactamase superfamily II)